MNCDSDRIHFEVENHNCWLEVLLNHGNPTPEQKTSALDFVCLNIMEIIKNDQILQLDIESFKNLLKSDNLAVTSEEVVFELVKRWLDFNNINPYDSLDSLLEVVRLPFIDPEYFLSEVLPYAAPITKCMFYIQETLRWHLFPEKRDKLAKSRTTPRGTAVNKVLVVGSVDFNTSSTLELYDFEKNNWRQLKKLNMTRRNYAAALVENEVLLIGGFDGKATNSVQSVNLKNGSISNLSPLNDTRFNFHAIVVGKGKSAVVYVVGGHGAKVLNGIERWDPINRQWTKLAPMSTARESCGLAHLNDNIYAAGGINGKTFHKSLEIYNIKTNAWRMGTPMIHVRSFCTLAASGEYIYAIGGHSGSYGAGTAISTVERYDPKTNRWTILANISSKGIVGAAGIGKSIFVVGGFSSNVVESYDTNSNKWNRLAPMNMLRSHSTVIPLPHYMSDYKFDW